MALLCLFLLLVDTVAIIALYLCGLLYVMNEDYLTGVLIFLYGFLMSWLTKPPELRIKNTLSPY